MSATFSTERLLHRASSHMTFKRLRAYWGGRRGGDGRGRQNSSGYIREAHSSPRCQTPSTNQNESACLTSSQMFHSFFFQGCFTVYNEPIFEERAVFVLLKMVAIIRIIMSCETCLIIKKKRRVYAGDNTTRKSGRAQNGKSKKINIPTEMTKARFSGIISGCDK